MATQQVKPHMLLSMVWPMHILLQCPSYNASMNTIDTGAPLHCMERQGFFVLQLPQATAKQASDRKAVELG